MTFLNDVDDNAQVTLGSKYLNPVFRFNTFPKRTYKDDDDISLIWNTKFEPLIFVF